jgi:hypothetical protein
MDLKVTTLYSCLLLKALGRSPITKKNSLVVIYKLLMNLEESS